MYLGSLYGSRSKGWKLKGRSTRGQLPGIRWLYKNIQVLWIFLEFLQQFLFQSFIDQLIEDKKSISQKCESLTVSIISIWFISFLFMPTPQTHIIHPGGDEDCREKRQGEHESDGEPAQPGDEQDQAGIHIKVLSSSHVEHVHCATLI